MNDDEKQAEENAEAQDAPATEDVGQEEGAAVPSPNVIEYGEAPKYIDRDEVYVH